MHGDEENPAEEHYEPFTQGKRKTPWQAFPDASSEAPGSGSGAASQSNAMLGLAGMGSAPRRRILCTWCLSCYMLGLFLNCAHGVLSAGWAAFEGQNAAGSGTAFSLKSAHSYQWPHTAP